MATDDIRIRLSLQGRSGFRDDLSGARDDLEGLGEGAQGAADQAGGAFSGLQGIAVGVAGAIGAAFATAAGVVAGVVDDMATSSGRMQARLGLTAEEVREFDAVAREVYGNNFAESMTEATDVVSRMHQTLGLTGDALAESTQDVFAITDAFEDLGAEPEALMESVRAMTAGFDGLTESQALDLITSGFQNGAGASGDMLDTLAEYSGLLGDIGISADDAFTAMSAGLEAGAFNTDYIADALKEFGIRINTVGDTAQEQVRAMFPADEADRLIAQFGEGGEAASEAFGMVTQALGDIEDPQARYTAAVELFGTKAEDLGGAFMPMLDAMIEGRENTEAVGDATETLAAQYGGFGHLLSGAWRQVQVGIADAVGPLLERYQPALNDLASRLGPAIASTFDALANHGSAMGARLAPVVEWWRNAWPGMSNAAQVAWGYIQPVINFLGDAVAWQWRNVLAPAFEFIATTMWPGIRTAITTAYPYIRDVVVGIRDHIVMMWDEVLTPAYEFWVDTMWPGIQSAIETAWPYVEAVFTAMGEHIGTAVDNWTAFRDGVAGVWTSIRSAAETAWNWVRDNVLNPMESALSTVLEQVNRLPMVNLGTGGGTTADTYSSSLGPTRAISIPVATTSTPVGGGSAAGSTPTVHVTYAPVVHAIDPEGVRRFFADYRTVMAEEVAVEIQRRLVTA